jgi:hypothetical protein
MASRVTTPSVPSGQQHVDSSLMAAYVQKLPAGSRVRAVLMDGRTVRGTLMHATDQVLVMQQRTRLPEPPVQIPLDTVWSVELDTTSSIGRSIAVAAASGAAGALAVILVLTAIFAYD